MKSRRDQLALAIPAEETPGTPSWRHEEIARRAGWDPVAGVDEAGRGPLAGPVVAAAVILPPGSVWPGLNDSKRLRRDVREALEVEIKARALAWSCALADPEEIDRLNILGATHLAMRRALEGLRLPPAFALVDGLPACGLGTPHQALVRGDSRSFSIAAASVLAKTERDRILLDLDRAHPEYGFARHKGYPTAEHLRQLSRHGPAPCHRRSYRPVAVLLKSPSPPADGS